jgi:deoxyxylulose-5-phosphate synthase
MAVARDAQGLKHHIISVIGDGGITGGMAYEAMNHAGSLDHNLIIILNDNQQVGPKYLQALAKCLQAACSGCVIPLCVRAWVRACARVRVCVHAYGQCL